MVAAVFISSDLIAIKPGGFTVRPSHAAMVFLSLLAPFTVLRWHWPHKFGWLLLWCILIFLFVPNTPLLIRSVAYAAWLALNVAFVFAVVQTVNTPSKLRFVLRWYALSFGIVGAFGLLQFFLPFVGIEPPLVRQWWIPDVLARINGFSYEPSYFAGYLAGGWIFILSLAKSRSEFLLSRKSILWLSALTSAALFFCGSRLGWGIMGIWLLCNFRNRKMLYALAASTLIVAMLAVWSMGEYQIFASDLEFLIRGTGLLGTSDYSLSSRYQVAADTLQVFLDSPIIGVSLGGVVPAIAKNYGHRYVDQSDASTDWASQCTTLEVLAATGVLGFPLYFAYIFGLLKTSFRLAKKSPLMRAMAWSFFAIMAVMQFHANILQGPVWIHIALLSAAISVAKSCYHRAP